MWGFITCLNDIIIPHLKSVFDLNYTQAMFIQFCFFFAYFLVSFPAGKIVERVGYQRGIVFGLLTAGIGTLLFYPAAGMRSYPMFLAALFVLASGITLLQVAANPFVAILGKAETASSRLNLTQAFNSLGTTIAPLLGAYLILSASIKTAEELAKLDPLQLEAYRHLEASSVQGPYLALTGVLFVIALIFLIVKLPVIKTADVAAAGAPDGNHDTKFTSAWKYRHLVLGAIAIFVYVGAEVSIGSFMVNYLGLNEIMGFAKEDAGKYLAFYWGGAMIGRFFGAITLSGVKNSFKQGIMIAAVFLLALALGLWISREYVALGGGQINFLSLRSTLSFILLVIVNLAAFLVGRSKPGMTLGLLAIFAAVLVTISMFTNGATAMWSMLAVGLFNSIMFPTIFTLAIDGLGSHTGEGSGILCMAIVGGALIPLIQGALADIAGLHHAYIIPIFCYLYIAYYGAQGHIPFWKNKMSKEAAL
jgi:FHS family L-fucose permease-like MFS transporter